MVWDMCKDCIGGGPAMKIEVWRGRVKRDREGERCGNSNR